MGAIDTSAHQRVRGDLGGATIYVLRRSPKSISDSLKRKGWIFDLDTEIKKLNSCTDDAIGLFYDWFHEIDYLKNVWESVVGEGFDRERAERLIEMNVQRTFASVQKRVLCSTSK